jgi:hypothetical protein
MSIFYLRSRLFLTCGLLVVSLLAATQSDAELVTSFDTTSSGVGTATGSVFTATLSGLVADGVTFDATLTATGSGSTIQNGNNGLGVDGTKVDSGELITYSMALSGFVGGTVTFDGFTSLDLANSSGSGNLVLSLDDSADTIGDNFFSGGMATGSKPDAIDITATLPTVFSSIAGPDKNDKFRIAGISARFTAVPEPSTLLTFGFVVSTLTIRRRRS